MSNYLNLVALWIGYIWLTLSAIRCIIGAVILTRQSVLDLIIVLRDTFTESTAMTLILEDRKKQKKDVQVQ